MSHTPALPLSGLKPLLSRAAGGMHRTTQRERVFELIWQWLGVLGVLFFLDLLFALPVWARWLGLLAQFGFVAWRLSPILRHASRKQTDDQHAARVVESNRPDVNNAFINAVQFGAEIDKVSELQAQLMRREIERAEQMATTVPAEEAVDRSGEVRSLRRLGGAVGVLVLVGVLFSGAFFAVMPRLFAPWMDDLTPPFSLTKIKISPAGALVRFGDNLVVSVDISGPTPDTLTLSTRSTNGTWREVALQSTEPGKYTATLEDLRSDTAYYAHGGGARSAKYLASVVLPPEAKRITATYTFPAYLKRKQETEQVGPGGIHGVRGEKAALEISGNRDLSGGELDVTSEDGKEEKFALTAPPDNAQSVRTQIPITGSGEFRVSLTGSDGQVNPSAAHGKIVLEQVQGPTVFFVQPEQEVLVTPTMKVDIQLEADADAGIAHVAMHRVINGIADNPEDLFKAYPAKHVDAQQMMDMGDLGVRPGDVITYYAAAYDGTPGTPGYAETEPYTLKVVSDEEYKKSLAEERSAGDLAKEIKDIVSATDTLAKSQQVLAEKMDRIQRDLAKNPNNASAQEQMKKAQSEQKDLQKQAEQLAKQLDAYSKAPSANDAEAAIRKKVGDVAKQVGEAAKSMQGAQSAKPSEAAQNAAKAAEQLKKATAKAQQQAGKAAEHMEEVAPLLNDVERFKALLNRQGQLVLQAQQFQDHSPKNAEERVAMQHISSEQQQMTQEMTKLQADFSKDSAAAAKDFPKAAASGQKIADEIGRRQIPSLMGQAHGQFAQQNGPTGFGNAKQAFEQMNAMMSAAGSCQGSAQGELDIALTKSLGQSGLGQQMAQDMSDSANRGSGQNPGDGTGSKPGDKKGPSDGGASAQPHAYVMKTDSIHSMAGVKKSASNRSASQADLSPDSVEMMKSSATKPPKATDASTAGYPPEYRKMINDYFTSVSKEKR